MPAPKKKTDLPALLQQLISGTAPGQTIKEKPVGAEGGGDPGWQYVIDLINKYGGEAAASDDAASALEASLAQAGLDIQRGQLGVQQGQLGVAQGQLALAEEAQAFTEEDIRNQRLLEAAGLATGPAGAIQLAYMARGQGAPQEEVASIFQNLPFVQELLHGQNVPGFGLPEQLGGESARTGGGLSTDVLAGPVSGTAVEGGVLVPSGGTETATLADVIAGLQGGGAKGSAGAAPSGSIQGQGLGVTIPGKRGITRQAFGTLSDFEQEFLGALGQSETGQSAAGFLQDIIKSFIPTRAAGAVSIG